MSYDAERGLVYLSASDNSLIYAAARDFNPNPLASNLGIDIAGGIAELGPNATAQLPQGDFLIAWDPLAQQVVWRTENPAAGTLATAAGLVFQGGASAFAARDSATGEQLWSAPTYTGVVAAPISYELDGEQYVAVVAGRSSTNYYAPNHSRLLVFKLGGTALLPEPTPVPDPVLAPPPATASEEVVSAGERVYQAQCFICHGDPGNAGGLFRRGLFPDLGYSELLGSGEGFAAVVLGGSRSGNGMVSFASVMSADDSEAVRAYLVAKANAVLAQRATPN